MDDIRTQAALKTKPVTVAQSKASAVDTQPKGIKLTALLKSTGWPASEIPTASAVVMAESHGDPTVDNGVCCVGLFQVNRNHAGAHGSPKNVKEFTQWLKNPFNNSMLAYKIFQEQEPKNQWSMSKWEAWGNGSYRQYIGQDPVIPVDGDTLKETVFGDTSGSGIPIIGGAIDGVNKAAGGVSELVGYVARLFDPYIWVRIGKAVLGFLMISLGLITLLGVGAVSFGKTPVGKTAAKVVKKAVVK